MSERTVAEVLPMDKVIWVSFEGQRGVSEEVMKQVETSMTIVRVGDEADSEEEWTTIDDANTVYKEVRTLINEKKLN